MSSKTVTILPELSRSYKSCHPPLHLVDHHNNNHNNIDNITGDSTTHKRKRKHPKDGVCCFGVKPRCSKNNKKKNDGIGMFATSSIRCGDLIVAYENPIVSSRLLLPLHKNTRTSQEQKEDQPQCLLFCHECSTPLGTLRDHLQSNSNEFVDEDNIDSDKIDDIGDGDDLVFTKNEDVIVCKTCHRVVWCSKSCWRMGQGSHSFLCNHTDLGGLTWLKTLIIRESNHNKDNCVDGNDNNSLFMIFQLAAHVVALILATYYREHQRKQEKQQVDGVVLHKYFWWKDYGSHPLWWRIGEPTQQENRQHLAKEFCRLLKESLQLKVQATKTMAWEIVILNDICTLQNIGEILGMLQCNVMEFEFPSPVQQYYNTMITMEDYGDDDDGDDGGCDTKRNIQDQVAVGQDGNENDADRTSTPPPPPPVIGSGLYPLLTLANHDCNPNASIEFLQESNRGSMVAIRDIEVGEEICITYIPNGDANNPSDGERFFRHFQPTRTWKWLNDDGDDDDDDDGDGNDDNSNSNNNNGKECDIDERMQGQNDHPCDFMEGNSSEEGGSNSAEGFNPKDRRKALLEYGFECQCKRCQNEMKAFSTEA